MLLPGSYFSLLHSSMCGLVDLEYLLSPWASAQINACLWVSRTEFWPSLISQHASCGCVHLRGCSRASAGLLKAYLKTNAGISRYPLDVTPPTIVSNLLKFAFFLQYLKKLQCDLLHILTQCGQCRFRDIHIFSYFWAIFANFFRPLLGLQSTWKYQNMFTGCQITWKWNFKLLHTVIN